MRDQTNPMLRTATRDDADQVAEIYLLSRKTFLEFAPLAHSDESVREWIREALIPSGNVVVAAGNHASSTLLGMMALSREEDIGWIDQLYLRPARVRRGLGTIFIDHAKRELTAPIRLYTFLENDGACRFYERHGFRVLEHRDGSNNEENCPDVLYEWP